RSVVTPSTEKVFLSLARAVHLHSGGLCVSQIGTGKLETIHEFSRCLGRPFFPFNCTRFLTHDVLCDIFKGLASTGAWVCFNGLNQLSASLLSILSQHLSSLLQAQQAGKSSVMIDTCEVPLNMDAGCFACLDSSVRVKPSNPENVLIFHSVASTLPQDLLVQFRAVSLVKPDNRFTMEVLLLSQGEKTCPLMYLNSIVARFPQCC
ncbi:hypothetical protein CAPTEDRAFT_107817, partial [Capitella teleta]